MIFTDAYLFKKTSTRSATRLDCTQSTRSYSPLEKLVGKEGVPFVYIGRDGHSKGMSKAELAVTHEKHISGLYTAPGSPWAFGDMKGTSDALIFDLSECPFEDGKPVQDAAVWVYVARGQARNRRELWLMVCDGEYNDELEELKSRCSTHNQQ